MSVRVTVTLRSGKDVEVSSAKPFSDLARELANDNVWRGGTSFSMFDTVDGRASIAIRTAEIAAITEVFS